MLKKTAFSEGTPEVIETTSGDHNDQKKEDEEGGGWMMESSMMIDSVCLSTNLADLHLGPGVGNVSRGNKTTGGSVDFSNWYQPFRPIVETYYPQYYSSYWVHEDKTQKAFALAQKLMDAKIVKVTTVKQFVELVNIIVSEM